MERPVDVDLRLENRPIRFLIVLAARLFAKERRKNACGLGRGESSPRRPSRLTMPARRVVRTTRPDRVWPAVLLGSLLLPIDPLDWAVRRRPPRDARFHVCPGYGHGDEKDSCELWLAQREHLFAGGHKRARRGRLQSSAPKAKAKTFTSTVNVPGHLSFCDQHPSSRWVADLLGDPERGETEHPRLQVRRRRIYGVRLTLGARNIDLRDRISR
jgi:hypothetical protein